MRGDVVARGSRHAWKRLGTLRRARSTWETKLTVIGGRPNTINYAARLILSSCHAQLHLAETDDTCHQDIVWRGDQFFFFIAAPWTKNAAHAGLHRRGPTTEEDMGRQLPQSCGHRASVLFDLTIAVPQRTPASAFVPFPDSATVYLLHLSPCPVPSWISPQASLDPPATSLWMQPKRPR